MKKNMITLALLAVYGCILMITAPNPAEAGRKQCVYMAHNPVTGSVIADGWAKAAKKSWACNRAQRRCNRELNRKRGQGKVGRGVVCRRIVNL